MDVSIKVYMEITKFLCCMCDNYIGMGDFGLCCKLHYHLCYENTEACDDFVPSTICKNSSSVVGMFRCSKCGAFYANWQIQDRCLNCGEQIL